MKIYKNIDKKSWQSYLRRPAIDYTKLEEAVSKIILEVRFSGDKALFEFTKKFDKVDLDNIRVEQNEIDNAENLLDEDLKQAILLAAANIEKFHRSQLTDEAVIETMPGVKCWRKAVPIEKVGLYIPGGTAPLFSTVLMLGIPARIAGCKEIILCSPCGKDKKLHPSILYAAKLIGINKIYKIGGAQAIAAMAFGTQTISAVQKIFGPGNQYVTMAKMLVSMSGVAIDMPAGPSEVMVVADETAKPEFVAADLLSQAEHGKDSQVILLSLSEDLVTKTLDEVNKQLEQLPRKNIAKKALEHSKAFVHSTEDELIEMMNEYAPEHLILSVKDYEKWIDKIENAGSVFLGNYTPESAGDYASGTNHTLPTNGFAKAFSGVSTESYMKKITFQEITPEGLKNIGKTIEIMAQTEDLEAHKNAVTIRLSNG